MVSEIDKKKKKDKSELSLKDNASEVESAGSPATPVLQAEDPEAVRKKAQAQAKKIAAEAGRARAKRAKEEAASASLQIAAVGETRVSPSRAPRLQVLYSSQIVNTLMKDLKLKNKMDVPRVSKVVLNCAVKEAVANPKVLDGTFEEIMAITGQKPVLTRARKSIAAFKVRTGNALAVKVTLRRARMYEFLERLMNVALPRVRDFKGVNPKSFDGRGNFSLGIREQIIFPEINYDKVDQVRGMTVTITTTAKSDEHARSLLTALGMPFRK